MAVLIPNEIDQEDLRRGGERLVFEWLSEPNVPGTVFYSLLQKNHKHKLIGEIDFLYVCERGLLCIEVKGGQEIYCKDKKWYIL
jgi:Holliday junction resolvase-like predicted endonuclease